MRPHTDQLAEVITEGSFSLELTADVFYGQTRTFQDLPLDDWSFTGNYDANVKNTGQVKVVYQGDLADTLKPREMTDVLAPFGQDLRVYAQISAGSFTERVPFGVYRLDDVPDAFDRTIPFASRTLVVGSVISLGLVDQFDRVDAASFRSLTQPVALGSAWNEIARVSRLQVTRTVPDVAIPGSLVYARSRLDTVQQLAAVLGGRAIMLGDGTLGVVPDALTAPVVTLTSGEPAGTIIDAGYSLSSADIRNCVVGDFEDAAGNAIHWEEQISDGPLAVTGPFGERVAQYPDDQKNFIRTLSAAQTAVRNHLAKVSTRGAIEIPVKTVPDVRLELGDVVRLDRVNETATVRVVGYQFSRGQALQLTMRTA